MEAKDTTKKSNELCTQVCQEHRTKYLEAKNCNGLDCEQCQLEKQAEISFKAGIKEVVNFFEPYKDNGYLSTWVLLRDIAWTTKLQEWGIE